ncbi:hypothetical protein RDWZM_003579 [Blomia tropicalis]|uniref:t-SNARE coiled-coil homology domain-containing protein n=1 Tax=Blomia tropicalis TaxID=40697 RepID=A0A9Q0MGD1_BLOTA|nr:hypothetical protein RDWZM_003579 [Blomia tropicalis]
MLPTYSNNKSIRNSFRFKEKLLGWLRLILSDQNSRNIFLFLLLNFSFAFVELSYGIWTNSLGLISDSFHMFFDCTALIAGLIASVITKWRADDKFSYGYVRAEILAGFVNGLFLIFVAFFIFTEALERVFEPPEVKHDRLFIISVLGLFVNLVGIFVFQHGGHGHSHGGGSHGHSHDHGHSHNHNAHHETMSNGNYDQYNFVTITNGHDHSHNHNHNHGHSHGGESSNDAPNSQIMKGVFLHIMADTLGSVGVIISAFLMSQFGWMIADPICSIFIAFLIIISVYPLLRDSSAILMQRSPKELDEALPKCYRRVMELDGVLSIQEPHFWTLCSDVYVGSVKIEVDNRADTRDLLDYDNRERTENLSQKVALLKNYAIDIENETKLHNRFLDEVDDDFDSNFAFLSTTRNRLNRLIRSNRSSKFTYEQMNILMKFVTDQ